MRAVNRFADAPTVFADGCLHAAFAGANMRITFAETIWGPSDNEAEAGMNVRHVLSLVIPRDGFLNMIEYLQNTAKLFDMVPSDAAAE